MVTELHIGDITVDVILKNIKNIHLSVYPPTGRVRISAPLNSNIETLRVYAISKLPWIKRNQNKLQEQARETPREFLERESHYVWGRRYLLKIVEVNATPKIELKHSQLIMNVRPNTQKAQMQELLEAWYRDEIKAVVPGLIKKWQKLIGVSVNNFYLQKMKTKWGSCNPVAANIRLNSELAKKPIECLEYVVVHELSHLLVPNHNAEFIVLMNQFIPKWKVYRDQLNQLPLQW
ncbi:M48 family metallopeptidase [Methylophilus sp.]|uniref:M48 family metallopeptidase n=1 Tax=Methylophilus sp. TaxID=29541 RepID=UPI0040372009